MKVLNLSTVHRWNDPRIFYKIARSLAKEHDVIHAAVGDIPEQVIDGVTVKPLGLWKSRWDRPKLWWRAFREIIHSGVDIVHFHDPELALLLIPCALLGNKKYICDIHEHPSGAIGGRQWIPRPFRKLTAACFSTILRAAPFIYDHVCLAEDRYKPLFPNRANVHIILNHALIPDPDIPLPDRYSQFDPQKELHLVYIGSLVEDRGAWKMMEMMQFLLKSFPHARLDLIGKIRPAELDRRLRQEADRSEGRIVVHGFMDFQQAAEYLKQAHIGLIPLQPHPNHMVSIVTKFYDYMIYGLPSVASHFPLWEDFLRDYPVGKSSDPTDPEKFADTIVELASAPETLRHFSETGYRLVREKFNWSSEERKLWQIYRG